MSRFAPRVGVGEEGPRQGSPIPPAGLTLHFQGWPAEGSSTPGSGSQVRAPPRPASQPGLCCPLALLPGLHLTLTPYGSPCPATRTYLHLALALAKVLSLELPSHMRLRATTGHTTQGQGLQFLNFQHLGRCLQELRGRCKEKGFRSCQSNYHPKTSV